MEKNCSRVKYRGMDPSDLVHGPQRVSRLMQQLVQNVNGMLACIARRWSLKVRKCSYNCTGYWWDHIRRIDRLVLRIYILSLEAVQKIFTRPICGMRGLSYHEITGRCTLHQCKICDDRFKTEVCKRDLCCGKSWDNQQERVWRLNHCRDFKGEAMGIGCNGKSMEEEMRLLLGPSWSYGMLWHAWGESGLLLFPGSSVHDTEGWLTPASILYRVGWAMSADLVSGRGPVVLASEYSNGPVATHHCQTP